MAHLQDELNEILAYLAVENNKPKTINGDDPIIDENWNCIVMAIVKLTQALGKINSVSPSLPILGYKYFRFPGEKLPWDLYPATSETDWLALHDKYEGVALRLAGGNASIFKADSRNVSYDEKIEIQNPDDPSKKIKAGGGGQMDALEKHDHTYSYAYQGSGGLAWGTYNIAHVYHTNKTTSDATGRKDIETRMKNITVEVYEYRADLNINGD